MAGFTLLHVLDDPKCLPCCPSSHGDMVLCGSAGGERVHRRGVAQSLVLRNCKRPCKLNMLLIGKIAMLASPRAQRHGVSFPGSLGCYPSARWSKIILGNGSRLGLYQSEKNLESIVNSEIRPDGNLNITKPSGKHGNI